MPHFPLFADPKITEIRRRPCLVLADFCAATGAHSGDLAIERAKVANIFLAVLYLVLCQKAICYQLAGFYGLWGVRCQFLCVIGQHDVLPFVHQMVSLMKVLENLYPSVHSWVWQNLAALQLRLHAQD
jgi:hypothetical protein